MQRVPGLRPTGQLPLRPAPVRSRVPTPDPEQLAPPRLQPVAQPVDTFVRPQAPPEDNNLTSLAEALSSLNPQLYTFLERRQRGSTTDALEYLQQTSIEGVNRLVRNGETPAVLQTREGRRVYGEARARADAERIRTLYTTEFQAGGGDIQDLISQVTGESFDLYGDDDTFMAVYTQVFDPLRNEILSQHNADAVALEMDERRADVFSAWHYRIEDGLRTGQDPSLIVRSIFADFPNNRDFLRLPYKEQQGYLLQLASQQTAAGNYDMATALLNMERVDGPYRGSLLSDPNTGEQAAQLVSQIQNARAADANRLAEDQAYETIIQEAVDAAWNGSILTYGSRTIISADGSTRTISQDEILQVAAERGLQTLAQMQEANRWTEEQAEQAEIEFLATSGLRHPVWVQGWTRAIGQLSLSKLREGRVPPLLGGPSSSTG